MLDKKSVAVGAIGTVVTSGLVYGIIKLVKWAFSKKDAKKEEKKAA